MKDRKYKMMTEEDFKKIKYLQEVGLSKRQMQDITARSSSTIWYICDAKDWSEYQEAGRKRSERSQELKEAAKATEVTDVVEAVKQETVADVVADYNEVISALNNLTAAVVTLSAVADRIGKESAINHTKSFLRR